MADEDFEEGEVWSYVNDHGREVSKRESTTFFTSSSTTTTTNTTSSGSRMIPRANACVEEHAHGRNQRQPSAPVNIPNWSKIYNDCSSVVVGDDGDNDDDDERVLPPHEWLAKKLARSQISSSSVCEGAGRTLKGRDQAKVRNAVLTKTGFLE